MVTLAREADAFAAAIRRALAERSPAERDRRIEVARRHRWDERIARMLALVEERLGLPPARPPALADTR